ncbi:hypothetical protein [Streptomyces pratensis]|uniref:hypothetical protein n=1 Tax=Streptomyces pratensis TaxID=1169025 RepID=UPI003017BD74
MAPGLPAVWTSRCVVGLMAVAGAALGPPGGTAYAAWAAGPHAAASAPGSIGSAATGAAMGAPSAPPVPASPTTSHPTGRTPPSASPAIAPPPPGGGASRAPETAAGPPPGGALQGGAGAPAGPALATVPASAAAVASTAGAGPVGGPGAASASPSPSASPEVTGSTAPLAGREAAVGKARPGRSLTPLELARAEARAESREPEEATDDRADLLWPTPPPGAFTDPRPPAGRALDGPAVRQVQQLSLGAGITLVGLGLGFLALRMRRAN